MHLQQLFEGESPQDIAILQDMLTRANHDVARAWMLENGAEEDDLATEDGFLWEFAYWLDQEHSIRVNNGIVKFWRLDDRDTAHMIGDNPVLLYHFTSSTRVARIRREGLVSGKRSVNRTQTPGVYLTTETSGPAITGYVRNALQRSRKGYGVQLHIRTFLDQIEPDPDDADISSGATQFVTDHVPPEQIIAVERAGY